MLTNDSLLTACKKTGKKIIMSTGMSTESEIDRAVEILEGINGDEIVVIETPHILRDEQSIQPILVKNKN